MCRSIISLSKIAHQMSRDHLFSQRNKTAEREVRVGVSGNREGGGGVRNKLKKEGDGDIEGFSIK